MISLYHRMAELARDGRPFAVATVVRTHGSTPQVVGAKLVVVADDERGRAAGTLGGGCVEADAIAASREVLETGGHSLRAYELTEALAWNTGLVCGGTMWILAERGVDALAASGRAMLDDLAQASVGGPPLAIATLFSRRGRDLVFAGRIFVSAGAEWTGTLGDADLNTRVAARAADQLRHGSARLISLDEHHDVLVEPVTGRPRLIVAGGGHVALAIARQAMLLDFDVTILEDRIEFADPKRFDGATVVAGDMPMSLGVLDYGWNSYVIIATRGHKLDADCVLAAAKTDVGYIGLLGSRRKTVLIEEMLREEGIDADRLKVIHAPVGLDLGGRTPAEIALSVMAEITQLRYAASGTSLSSIERRGPLHPA
jgi:xanthine dehydrogenase accessory factor